MVALRFGISQNTKQFSQELQEGKIVDLAAVLLSMMTPSSLDGEMDLSDVSTNQVKLYGMLPMHTEDRLQLFTSTPTTLSPEVKKARSEYGQGQTENFSFNSTVSRTFPLIL
jgi:hypothetical protein